MLRGERIPLNAGATKTLHFILHGLAQGCDATITANQFAISYGPRGPHSQYIHDLGPVVVSWLLDAAPGGKLAPGSLPWWGGMPGTWPYGSFGVWIKAEPECVTIRVRSTAAHSGTDEPEPFPPPFVGPPEYLPGAHPCPHCAVVPDRYRKLSDGALVCMACGASSRAP